jgi:hypothetical protein
MANPDVLGVIQTAGQTGGPDRWQVSFGGHPPEQLSQFGYFAYSGAYSVQLRIPA